MSFLCVTLQVTVEDHEKIPKEMKNEETYRNNQLHLRSPQTLLPNRSSQPSMKMLGEDCDLQDIGLWLETKKEGYRALWVVGGVELMRRGC